AVRLTLRGAVPPGHRWWGAGVRQTDPDGPGAGAAGEQRADRGRGGPGSRIYRSVLLLPAVPRRLRGEPLAVPRRLPRRAGATSALTGAGCAGPTRGQRSSASASATCSSAACSTSSPVAKELVQ